jgi:hypothetical protein
LSAKGYLTSIPSEYVTESELSAKGYATKSDVTAVNTSLNNYYTKEAADLRYQPKGNYLTSIPSEYVTESELAAKGYITSIPSQYVTESELSAKGYLTSIPSEYVTDTELTNKDYATKTYVDNANNTQNTQINSKQAKLVSGTNIKTINGQSILGSGNIEIKGGTDTDLTGYATENWVTSNYQPKGNYLTSVPSEYITESELLAKGYATTASVNTKQDKLYSGVNLVTINGQSLLGSGNIQVAADVDMSNYYTKAQIDTMVGAINQILGSLINDIDTESLENSLNTILFEK